tara:strand:+ start:799 stop:987 length:189 start_codon:yes stop_codon:yes gene_type:complete
MAYTDVVLLGLDEAKHDMICQLKGESIPFTKLSEPEPHNIRMIEHIKKILVNILSYLRHLTL